jgi:anti-sigma regulatory factor (Ser/Thr protein kinase)
MTAGRPVAIEDRSHLHAARRAAARAATAAGLSDQDTAACELVASELATNLVLHAGGGLLLVNVIGPPPGAVQLVAVDDGPGIADVASSLADGFSTTGTLGAGLGACRRAAREFDIHSRPGRGTAVLAQIGSCDGAGALDGGLRIGGVLTPHPSETVSGDGWCAVQAPDPGGAAGTGGTGGLVVGVVDGLGHGPPAAEATRLALEALREGADASAECLAQLDARLRGSRGAAVGLAQVVGPHSNGDGAESADGRRVRFAGIGNIGARLATASGSQSLLSRPGVVGGGRRVPPLRQSPASWGEPGVLALWSDGVRTFDPDRHADVLRHHPALVAALVWRDAHRPHDDATVVVVSDVPGTGA